MVGKNRPHWRAPLKASGSRNAVAPKNGIRFGKVPDKWRCRVIARSTGERCKQPKLHGSGCCHKHGGHSWAYDSARKELGKHALIVYPPIRAARKVLAQMGATAPREWSKSIIERGRMLEATLNSEMIGSEAGAHPILVK